MLQKFTGFTSFAACTEISNLQARSFIPYLRHVRTALAMASLLHYTFEKFVSFVMDSEVVSIFSCCLNCVVEAKPDVYEGISLVRIRGI